MEDSFDESDDNSVFEFARRAAHFGRLALDQSSEQQLRLDVAALRDEMQQVAGPKWSGGIVTSNEALRQFADRLSRLLVEQE